MVLPETLESLSLLLLIGLKFLIKLCLDLEGTVGLHDIKGRKDILKVYKNNTKLDKDVSLSVIGMGTLGFSGTDLENLMNNAAILAGRRGKDKITSKENLPKSSISFITHTIILR
ncbi:ATP-dependent zinc metalloprotease FTSH 6, chloroplastic [Capsicum baccatum]|uniref:ATP-dependent zinc metalloprotease FTSH, chloroplastic n=1 Tax=Capsicum baccatum TaxID=33114 RepID=A0A2G2WJ15_CAPBA|nr:ATP-dependent zinc metalloprotease FTSH 6, chloroplastic [Capsicum baccatum]